MVFELINVVLSHFFQLHLCLETQGEMNRSKEN